MTTLSMLDIDECYHDNGGCEQECINTGGSYTCDCYQGFTFENQRTVTSMHFAKQILTPESAETELHIAITSCLNLTAFV